MLSLLIYFPKNHVDQKNNQQICEQCCTYIKFLVSDGYDTAQETSNNQQYG